MDLQSCVLHVATTVLVELAAQEFVSLNVLGARLEDKHGKGAAQTFLGALGFLFIIGKIEYHEELDAVALTTGESL